MNNLQRKADTLFPEAIWVDGDLPVKGHILIKFSRGNLPKPKISQPSADLYPRCRAGQVSHQHLKHLYIHASGSSQCNIIISIIHWELVIPANKGNRMQPKKAGNTSVKDAPSLLFGRDGHSTQRPHLEHDFFRRLVGVEKVADVDEGPLLGGAVLVLEVIPPKLDELLAVLHQLALHLADEQRSQLQQLDADRLLVHIPGLQGEYKREGGAVSGERKVATTLASRWGLT